VQFYMLRQTGSMPKRTREHLLSRMPGQLNVEATQGNCCNRYSCRLVAAAREFVVVEGMAINQKSFFLRPGSKVILGFSLPEGWAELEAEVAGWSAGDTGTQIMLKCAPTGAILQRRHSSRLEKQMPVVCASLEGSSLVGRTRNLSRDGLSVFFSFPLPTSQKLYFRLLPEAGLPILLKGGIAWKRPSGGGQGYLMGVRMEPATEAQKRHYGSLLSLLRRSGKEARGKLI